eukprot:TRINITY_DN21321_c0_g1_i2.p1 TRINITY_DN21321_c0_g1~~TRINITY_DN21321_c0_g1_i2.p1  ORF type:complete len:210 (+),score=16.87 TRINITY_DN21321_c0_g1_i2:181-810(+)
MQLPSASPVHGQQRSRIPSRQSATGGPAAFPASMRGETFAGASPAAMFQEEMTERHFNTSPTRTKYRSRKIINIPMANFLRPGIVPKSEVKADRNGEVPDDGLPLTAPPAADDDPFRATFDWVCSCSDGCLMCEEVKGCDKEEIDGQGNDHGTPGSARGLPSVGSACHDTGDCRPCAHAWRVGGCSRGVLCERCHVCTHADFRRESAAF